MTRAGGLPLAAARGDLPAQGRPSPSGQHGLGLGYRVHRSDHLRRRQQRSFALQPLGHEPPTHRDAVLGPGARGVRAREVLGRRGGPNGHDGHPPAQQVPPQRHAWPSSVRPVGGGVSGTQLLHSLPGDQDRRYADFGERPLGPPLRGGGIPSSRPSGSPLHGPRA